VHEAAPILFKNIERVEGIMFLFSVALLIQGVIERKVRLAILNNIKILVLNRKNS
jgi:transposase